jgi:oxygen-independent coproporphyrinogen-3 oxidase
MTKKTFSDTSDVAANLIAQTRSLMPTSIYLHIPFCRRRCYYCDFPISVVGDGNWETNSASNWLVDYLKAIEREIALTPKTQQPIQTIFFGGGTPSLLPVQALQQILKQLDRHFTIANDAEISMEVDPGTFDRAKLQGYLHAGINRFSLGVQSFDDDLLTHCGRFHNTKDIYRSIELIKSLGVTNFSLDLMSDLPEQTLDRYRDSLLKAISIAPTHLSCYDLVLESVTAFGKQYQPGIKPLPSDEDAAAMYRLTRQILTDAGYQHYEISNYAKLGYQCRHNRVYWQNLPYYGLGMGAASYFDGKRFTRPRTRREYYAWLEAGAIIDVPETSSIDRLLETLMLGLRLAEGIALDQFDRPTRSKIVNCLQPYLDRGWVNIDDTSLSLSDPEGFLFSNTILSALFESLE